MKKSEFFPNLSLKISIDFKISFLIKAEFHQQDTHESDYDFYLNIFRIIISSI